MYEFTEFDGVRLNTREVVRDSFNRADNATTMGNAETGQAWTVVAGSAWGIIGNQAYIPAPVAASQNQVIVASGQSDVIVTVRFATVAQFAQVLFRRLDVFNWWDVIADGTSNRWQFRKITGGAVTASFNYNVAPANGTVVQVRAVGDSIRVYFDGIERMSTTDSDLMTATHHGIGQTLDFTGARFDDFSVQVVSPFYVATEQGSSVALTTDLDLRDRPGDFPTVQNATFNGQAIPFAVLRNPDSAAPADNDTWDQQVKALFSPHVAATRLLKMLINGVERQAPVYITALDPDTDRPGLYEGAFFRADPAWEATVLSGPDNSSPLTVTGAYDAEPELAVHPNGDVLCKKRTFTITDRCGRGVFDYPVMLAFSSALEFAVNVSDYDLYFNGRRIPFAIQSMSSTGTRLYCRVDLPPNGTATLEIYYGFEVNNPVTGGAVVTQNIITDQNLANAVWIAYGTKPGITAGIADPHGGTGAYRLASAGTNHSGLIWNGGNHSALLNAVYAVSGWARTVSGTLTLNIGLDENHLQTLAINTSWRYFVFTFAVAALPSNNRIFEIFENAAGNPDWELFNLSVEMNILATDHVDPSQYNQVRNGSLDAGVAGYAGLNGTVLPETSLAHRGSQSARLTQTVLAAGGTWTGVDGDLGALRLGVIPGQAYTGAVWVYVPSGSGVALNTVSLQIYDFQAGYDVTASAPPTAFDTWQRLVVTRTIRAAATEAFMRIHMADNVVGAYFFFDTVKFQIGPIAWELDVTHPFGPFDPAGLDIGHPNFSNTRWLWNQTRLSQFPNATGAWHFSRLGKQFPGVSATFNDEPTFLRFDLLPNQSGDEDVDGIVLVNGVEAAASEALRNITAVLAGTGVARRVKYRRAGEAKWRDAAAVGNNFDVDGAVSIAVYIEATTDQASGNLEIYSANGKFTIGSSPWELLLDVSKVPLIQVGAAESYGILRGDVTNSTTGDVASFDDVYVAAAADLVIDTAARSIEATSGTLTGAERITFSNRERWFTLAPGSNAWTEPFGADVTFRWRERAGG